MIRPSGSFLDFVNSASPSASGRLQIADHRYKDDFFAFKRIEFTGDKMRSAKNIDGSVPTFGYGAGKTPIQYFSNCNENETDRPTDPDDNRIDSIHKRFDYTEWEILGMPSEDADVEALRTVRKEHVTRFARFEAHQEIAQGDVSFAFLENELQPQVFTYMTQTNLSMTGRVFGDGVQETNLLIVAFEPITEQLIPLLGEPSTTDILRAWRLVLQRRIYRAARSTTF